MQTPILKEYPVLLPEESDTDTVLLNHYKSFPEEKCTNYGVGIVDYLTDDMTLVSGDYEIHQWRYFKCRKCGARTNGISIQYFGWVMK